MSAAPAAAAVVEDSTDVSSAGANPKIIDLITRGTTDGTPFVSLEYFPPRTEEGVKVRLIYKRPGAIRRLGMNRCLLLATHRMAVDRRPSSPVACGVVKIGSRC
jgi:hypothetical protein